MKLEMKAIKHSEFASQETYCYEAKLYVDGEPFAIVSNDGHGGADMQYPVKGFKGDFHARLKEVENWLSENHPPVSVSDIAPDMEPMKMTLELWCGQQVSDFLARKDMKRICRGHIVGKMADGKIYQWKRVHDRYAEQMAAIRAKHPDVQILNEMSESDALEAWKSAA